MRCKTNQFYVQLRNALCGREWIGYGALSSNIGLDGTASVTAAPTGLRGPRPAVYGAQGLTVGTAIRIVADFLV
jgi:hypothetical protein